MRWAGISYVAIQATLIVLWATGVIDGTPGNLILVTAVTWGPYGLAGILKIVEIILRKRINKKQVKNGKGQ